MVRADFLFRQWRAIPLYAYVRETAYIDMGRNIFGTKILVPRHRAKFTIATTRILFLITLEKLHHSPLENYAIWYNLRNYTRWHN
jgi:hypothetical protein